MLTSNFSAAKDHPGAIAICRGLPRWSKIKYKRYIALAPTRQMLSPEGLKTFDREYDKILAQLDPAQVLKDLIDLASPAEPVLLCWEGAHVRCHRRRVAEWLESHLDIQIAELGFERSASPPYVELPRKGSKVAAKAIRKTPKSLSLF